MPTLDDLVIGLVIVGILVLVSAPIVLAFYDWKGTLGLVGLMVTIIVIAALIGKFLGRYL